ncbi:MBG domain-containing protein [Fibrella sp. ES10-3-2-2]|nr:hypothetical protein A6C57_02820 [Fibrella sp. ES10-3-2-2]
MTINKATPTIALVVGGPYTYDGTAKAVTSAVVNGVSGSIGTATVVYSQGGSPVASPTDAGSYAVTADYAGSANYLAATQQTGTLVISKATATLTLGNLTHVYDGTAKFATVTTSPAGLAVTSISNNGQTNAGTYAVTASLDNANYMATPVTQNLVISKATATLTLGNLTHVYDGTAKFATVTTSPAGLEVTSISNNGQTNAGTYAVTASLDNANYMATPVTQNLVISKATATLTLGNLTHVYDGTAKFATVTTSPAGLAVTSIANNGQTNAGTYAVTASLDNANYMATPVTQNLVISKATATLTLGNLTHVYDGTAKFATVTTSPAGLEVTSISNNGQTNAGTYAVTASLDNANYMATPVTQNLVISKATATLTLGNLTHVYDGTAKFATVTTSPAGLAVTSIANNGQTNAGTYAVTASLDNANYMATPVTQNLVISKATATLTLGNLTHVYDGTAKFATVTTSPAGLAVTSIANNGQTNAGTYAVTASLDNANYMATPVTENLVISKATATLTLGNLTHVYDGTAKFATVTTSPAGLAVTSIANNGQTNAGTYAVTASLDNANYMATPVTENLVISKATATLTLGNLTHVYDGTAKFATVTTSPAGLAVTSIANNGQTNAGTYAVTASLDNANYMATPVTQNLVISKATATLTLGNLTHVYDGTAKFATVTTSPAGLEVTSISNNGQTNAGTYAVTASLDNANYMATPVTQNLVISKATATLTLGNLTHVYDGTAKFATVTTSPAGLAVTSISNNGQTNAGTYAVTASLDNANYTAEPVTQNLVISKATATLSLGNLTHVYDGTAKFATVTTSPAGLAVTSIANNGQTNAGTYAVTASLDNANYMATPVTQNLVISKATATLTLGNLTHVYDGTAKFATVTTSPAGLEVTSISNNGQTNAGTYAVTASLDNANYMATPVTQNLVISKATATLTLGNLTHVYDGTAKFATVTTSPAGLAVTSIANNGQTNAGTYAVTASLDNANYMATPVTENLVISKATATLTLGNLTHVYDGTAKFATVTTSPAGLAVTSIANNGQTNAGTYAVTASLDNANYMATPVTQNLVISKATATLTLGNLTHVYDGTAKFATVTTSPAGLAVTSIANNGQTNAGTYAVTASLDNANYMATPVTENLVINKATATLTLGNLTHVYDGTAKFATVTTSPAGLAVTSIANNGQTNAGTYAVTASLDNANYMATPVTQNLVISKATATLTLGNLTHVYDGTAKFATVTTSPAGLAVTSIANNGQTNAGTYAVTASLDNANYTATPVTENLVIDKATPVITLVVGGPYTYSGSAKSVTSAVVTGVNGSIGNATVVYKQGGSAVSPINAGSYDVTADFTETANYFAAAQQTGTLVIGKATPTIALVVGGPYTYDATAKAVTSAVVNGVSGSIGTATVAYSQGGSPVASPTNAGSYDVTANFAETANYFAAAQQTGTLVINKKALTVTANNQTKIYGTAFSFAGTEFSTQGLVGGNTVTMVTLTSAGSDALANVAGSPYPIVPSNAQGSGLDNYAITYQNGTFTVNVQTANPLAESFYTGSIFFWTPSSTNSTATLTLAATIKNAPNYGGDIRTARVSFFIRNSSGGRTPISGAQNLPVGLVNPGDLSVGSAAATIQYNLGSANVASLEIGIEVSGNYRVDVNNPQYDKIVTVAKPTPGGLIVGGVDLDATTAAGYVKGYSNLSFNVQYNKSLKNPQGTVEAIVVSPLTRDGVIDGNTHTYRLKSNAISVLAVGQPSPGEAQFTSKANISEVINGVDQAIEGNCTMQFDMRAGSTNDKTGDEVAITVYRAKGGIWYSNNWNGTKTVLKQIAAGNVSVSGGSAGGRIGVEESSEPTLQLTVEASPNPTKGLLNVSVKGAGDQPSVKIRLYNLMQGVSGEWALDLQDGQGQKTIDIQSVNEGMYFLSVEGTNGRAVQRVLKGN